MVCCCLRNASVISWMVKPDGVTSSRCPDLCISLRTKGISLKHSYIPTRRRGSLRSISTVNVLHKAFFFLTSNLLPLPSQLYCSEVSRMFKSHSYSQEYALLTLLPSLLILLLPQIHLPNLKPFPQPPHKPHIRSPPLHETEPAYRLCAYHLVHRLQ